MEYLACLGLIVALPLLVGVSSVLNGWVLAILWAWFVVPLFHTVGLTVPEAIGIAMVVSHLTYHGTSKVEKEDSDVGKATAKLVGDVIGRPFFVLLYGFILYHFWPV